MGPLCAETRKSTTGTNTNGPSVEEYGPSVGLAVPTAFGGIRAVERHQRHSAVASRISGSLAARRQHQPLPVRSCPVDGRGDPRVPTNNPRESVPRRPGAVQPHADTLRRCQDRWAGLHCTLARPRTARRRQRGPRADERAAPDGAVVRPVATHTGVPVRAVDALPAARQLLRTLQVVPPVRLWSICRRQGAPPAGALGTDLDCADPRGEVLLQVPPGAPGGGVPVRAALQATGMGARGGTLRHPQPRPELRQPRRDARAPLRREGRGARVETMEALTPDPCMCVRVCTCICILPHGGMLWAWKVPRLNDARLPVGLYIHTSYLLTYVLTHIHTYILIITTGPRCPPTRRPI